MNVGNCLLSTAACGIANAPGAIPYWGLSSGAADPSFTFVDTGSGDHAALEIELAGNAGINEFGWYDPADPKDLHVIFTGPDSVSNGGSATFAPSATYGFWFTGSEGTYFTQSTLGTDLGQHFAVFAESLAAGSQVYWLGMEDLNLASSDKDYQDMIVKVTALPEPGVIVLLIAMLASVAIGSVRPRLA
jgi:hypothetical protein